jgi:hypothetical protein
VEGRRFAKLKIDDLIDARRPGAGRHRLFLRVINGSQGTKLISLFSWTTKPTLEASVDKATYLRTIC